MRCACIFVLCALLLSAPGARAQQSARDSLAAPPPALTGDSVAVAAPSDTGFVMQKSPGGAVLRSALLPGLGQFYNESYWKIPVILGLGAYLVRGIIVEHASYADYRDLYAASITGIKPAGDPTLKYYREFYRDNRDTYAWWFAVLYLLQIADAFVDAHLYDFDVSDEVHSSLQLFPAGRVGVQIRW